jgi:hypothetical protein
MQRKATTERFDSVCSLIFSLFLLVKEKKDFLTVFAERRATFFHRQQTVSLSTLSNLENNAAEIGY